MHIMSAILSGKIIRDERIKELSLKIAKFKPTPELAIFQIGDRADSTAYIKAKVDFANKIGVFVRHIHFLENDTSEKLSQDRIILEIEKQNKNPEIKGIIVQLPLPDYLDKDAIIESIDPKKDIDGLTRYNNDLLDKNDNRAIIPATARGVMELLEYYGIDVKEKNVTVVGRSRLVGSPIAKLMSNKGAIVNVAHSKTENLAQETLGADIIIVAVGMISLINKDHVRKGQIVIDVGINTVQGERLEEEIGKRKLVGDVDFLEVSKVIGDEGAITSVPGGVGPMTVLALFENLIDTCK